MAAGFISYSIKADKAFEDQLKRAVLVVKDLRPAFTLIAKDFVKSEQAIFRLQSSGAFEDFVGPKISDLWKSPGRPESRTRDGSKTAYQFYKIKKFGFDYPLLKASGALEESLTEIGGDGNITNIGKQSLEIGTSVSYAKFHQQGTKRLPMRKHLFIGPESNFTNSELRGRLERWNNILNTFVLRSLGQTLGESTGKSGGS